MYSPVPQHIFSWPHIKSQHIEIFCNRPQNPINIFEKKCAKKLCIYLFVDCSRAVSHAHQTIHRPRLGRLILSTIERLRRSVNASTASKRRSGLDVWDKRACARDWKTPPTGGSAEGGPCRMRGARPSPVRISFTGVAIVGVPGSMNVEDAHAHPYSRAHARPRMLTR